MVTDPRSTTAITWDELPAAVTTYLISHRGGHAAAALTAFADDAAVTDEGHTHAGRASIAEWLNSAGSEYTYSTEFRSAVRTGPDQYDVLQRLEGDFPGGVADLHFRFSVADELVTRLVIEP